MSKSEKQILRALDEIGLVPVLIRWEPIGSNMEMCGPSGGWYVNAECPMEEYHNLPSTVFVGYSVGDILGEIYRYAATYNKFEALEKDLDFDIFNGKEHHSENL